MIQLVLYLVLGAAFLASLYAFARRSASAEGGAQIILRARQALSALQADLLPPQVFERIFANGDYRYIISAGDPALTAMFLSERRKIALSWVEQIRRQIVSLREFHLGSARLHSQLSPRVEARLAFEFFTLLCVCRFLQLALYLRGPYAAPRMVGRVVAVAARVCATSEEAMGFLSAVKVDRLAGKSAHKITAL